MIFFSWQHWAKQATWGLFFGLMLCPLWGCAAQPAVNGTQGTQALVTESNGPTAAIPEQITVQQLAQRIEAKDESYWLIDVRTAEEVAIATIPTSTHIPIAQITDGSAIERIQAERGDRQII